MKVYRVRLYATLPTSATLIISAKNPEQARDLAEQHWADADWQGADYDRPSGSDVEIGEIKEIE